MTVVDTAATSTGSYVHFEPRQLTPTIGAELIGLDLAGPLDDSLIAEVRRALLEFKVVFFRDQHIDRAQHIAFARRFGELEIHPATPRDAEHREILRIEHGPNSRGTENNWHSDVTWRERPSLGSILRAIELPPVGGDTLFSDMYAAYDGLSPELQQFACGLTAVHDIARVFAAKLGRKAEELHEKFPPQEHPVIRTHPETGRRLVYTNIAFTDRIKGLSAKESEWLLDRLNATANNPDHQCRFRWAPGSLAFWDNRAVQHFAASDYFPQRRVMERVTIAGDKPYFTPTSPAQPYD
ncbi:MAG: taurine dioxygenase [Ilumatobacteraceae bacterium]|nr:taurine dioxygenase [Ilumatobacteraceae bacterium]